MKQPILGAEALVHEQFLQKAEQDSARATSNHLALELSEDGLPAETWTKDAAHFTLAHTGLEEDLCFYIDVVTGEYVAATVNPNALTQQDMIDYFDLVNEADPTEIAQFTAEAVWKVCRADTATTSEIDCTWIRTWKRIS